MNEMVIRPAVPESDFERLAGLLTLVEPEPVTAEMLAEWEARNPPGQIRQRLVAESPAGELVGYGIALHNAWAAVGHFYLWLTTHPDWRGRGLGRRLYDRLLAATQAHGAGHLISEVRDDQADSLAFAQRRGFTIERHLFESVLDLTTFDERPFAGLVAQVESLGIRFFSLAEAADYESAFRRLHALNYQLSLDDPAGDGTFPSYAEFHQILEGSSWFLPAGQILASDGDRFVGLAAVGYTAETNAMRNMITGVDRDYRGRKIAQALKLQAIRFASHFGATTITTSNDSQNGAILAINRKLGYVSRPGIYRLARTGGGDHA
jgi:GNAT superfamily N-acetyltransferase